MTLKRLGHTSFCYAKLTFPQIPTYLLGTKKLLRHLEALGIILASKKTFFFSFDKLKFCCAMYLRAEHTENQWKNPEILR